MAEATLNDVISRMKAEGQLSRNTGTNSLKVAIIELRALNTNFSKFFEFFKENLGLQNRLLSLQDPEKDSKSETKESDKDKKKPDQLNLGLGQLAGVGLLALAAGVNGFFDDIVNAIRAPRTLALIASGIRSFARALTVFDFLKKPLDLIKRSVASVGNVFTGIGNFFSSTFGKEGFIGRNLQKIANFVKPVLEFFKPIIDLFKKVFAPITTAFSSIGTGLKFLKFAMGPVGFIIFGIIDFVKGFIKGFGENGFLGGIKEGLLEAIRGIITKPLDLLKDIVSWAAGKLGFSEFEGMLDSFSFTDMFDQFIVALEDIFEDVSKWFSTLFSDPVAAIEQAASAYLGMYRDFGGWVYRNAIKPVTDWLGGLFGVDITGTLESYVGEFMSFFKDTGSWIWNKTLKPVVDWLGEIFGGERSLKAEVMGLWNEAVSVLKSNFASVTNWLSSIPDRILFAAEEMWIETVGDLKKNFLKLVNYLVSIPDQMLLGAQELVLNSLGAFAARQIGITPESIAEQKQKIASKSKPDDDLEKRLDIEKTVKLDDLIKRREAALSKITEGTPGNNSGNSPVVVQKGGDVYNNYNYGDTNMGSSVYSIQPGVSGLPSNF